MNGMSKRKVIVAGVAALAVAVTGGAVAATKADSPKAESQAVVNDAATQLGVQPGELSAALRKAMSNRVDAAVEARRITRTQGDVMKARINSGDFPLFGGPHRGMGEFGHGPHLMLHGLDAAASYLGLTEAELRTRLNGGKTLAQVAKAQNKSVDGLVEALVEDATDKIDQAVEDGRMTKAQADEIRQNQRERITEFVNGQFRFELRHRGGPNVHPEPPMRDGPEALPPPIL